jgi:hypothetical protein
MQLRTERGLQKKWLAVASSFNMAYIKAGEELKG